LLGLRQGEKIRAEKLANEYDLGETVRVLPPITPPHLPSLYQGCAALYHPTPLSPWGGPVLRALACARPVVALDEPLTHALVGEAAYTVTEGDGRGMGAAFISVVIKEELSRKLTQAARRRAAAWRSSTFSDELLGIYKSA
jgi:glycosyltransferase involved in cell wall biosynthesis